MRIDACLISGPFGTGDDTAPFIPIYVTNKVVGFSSNVTEDSTFYHPFTDTHAQVISMPYFIFREIHSGLVLLDQLRRRLTILFDDPIFGML